MKRKHLNKQPGIGDFKNKCSEMVRSYDAKIIRIIYDITNENYYWNGKYSVFSKKEIQQEIEIILKKKKVYVLFLEKIVQEIIEYLEKFQALIDLRNQRQK